MHPDCHYSRGIHLSQVLAEPLRTWPPLTCLPTCIHRQVSWGGGAAVDNPHYQRLHYCELLVKELLQRLAAGRGARGPRVQVGGALQAAAILACDGLIQRSSRSPPCPRCVVVQHLASFRILLI